MRILHTSDWHLGRLFHGAHLTDDQAFLLDQLVSLAKDLSPHLLIVAGDVYDRAVPPPEAVELLSDTLSRLALDLKIPTLLIAGNHDSPARLDFGSRVMARQGLHVFGTMEKDLKPLPFEDEHGPVSVFPLPYAEPGLVRDRLGAEEAKDHQSAAAVRIDQCLTHRPSKARTVAVAHVFTAGGAVSESERPLSVGGSGAVEPELFRPFDFTALGHLHRPQNVGTERVHYSGSLMKYSFSEAGDQKSVSLVEMDADGVVRIERICLTPRRDLRRVSGLFHELLEKLPEGVGREDYLEVELLDREVLFEPMARLREVYPNVLHILRPHLQADRPAALSGDHRRQAEAELFDSFFRQVTGDEMTPQEREMLEKILTGLEAETREAGR